MEQNQLMKPLVGTLSSLSRTKPAISIPNKRSFIRLPTEIHMHIASLLSYPDALALKHTNSYLYSLVRTNLPLRVDWIIERHEKGLAVPRKNCVLRTDELFCNSEVNQIMERRRWHLECKRGRAGCRVVEGSSCGGLSAQQLLKGKRLMLILSRGGIYIENRVLFAGALLGLIALLWRFFINHNV
ncbi:F-box domain-containing protein [Nannizzia gypsea CBS 118893]|uniref:F-box domain-containing protein n=1 Tax=Arthroderma gypseum (strain ATCC MYA-4604 / CBS 118893) TaxID=535722 RepID=E5R1S4_ARTGP|nr:F-box domain-containing protein [Nannizzia gypsea CBS 118893]EFQ98558.1 F-box domain-containing protein [Nannizzia gypsea CBS 118893]